MTSSVPPSPSEAEAEGVPEGALQELAAELSSRVEILEDGSAIVVLRRPTMIGTEEHGRLRLRAICFGDVRDAFVGRLNLEQDDGQLTLAERLCEPSGAINALRSEADVLAVIWAVGQLLGNFRSLTRGESSSPPSGATSVGRATIS